MSAGYSNVARCLHWLIGLAIVFMIGLGFVMGDMPRANPMKFQLYQLHKSIGICILLLSLFRLCWRMTHKPPALPADMKKWEKILAHAVSHSFYLFMIGVPLLGWAVVSASPLNIPTLLFGVVPWPHLPFFDGLENRHDVAESLGDIHGTLAYAMLGLLALHVVGALKHHFIVRDDVLVNMAPGFMRGLLLRLRG